MRRETLKAGIDEQSDELIGSVEGTRASCVLLAKHVDPLTARIGESKEELARLLQRFDTFKVNQKHFDDIKVIPSFPCQNLG